LRADLQEGDGMKARVLHGDCRALMRDIEPNSIDLVIADPPYGETSLAWDRWPVGWMDELPRIMAPHASLWMFGSQRMFFERAGEIAAAGFGIAQDLVWEKHNGSNAFADRFRRVHEHAVQFYPVGRDWAEIYKRPVFTNDATARTVRRKKRPPQWGELNGSSYASEDGGPRLMRSVMCVRSEHGRAMHPTQKPVACVLPLIEYSVAGGGACA